jgi:hypothetical protein
MRKSIGLPYSAGYIKRLECSDEKLSETELKLLREELEELIDGTKNRKKHSNNAKRKR